MNTLPYLWLIGALASAIMAIQTHNWLGKGAWMLTGIWLVVWALLELMP